eukprot:gene533-biopygen6035
MSYFRARSIVLLAHLEANRVCVVDVDLFDLADVAAAVDEAVARTLEDVLVGDAEDPLLRPAAPVLPEFVHRLEEVQHGVFQVAERPPLAAEPFRHVDQRQPRARVLPQPLPRRPRRARWAGLR